MLILRIAVFHWPTPLNQRLRKISNSRKLMLFSEVFNTIITFFFPFSELFLNRHFIELVWIPVTVWFDSLLGPWCLHCCITEPHWAKVTRIDAVFFSFFFPAALPGCPWKGSRLKPRVSAHCLLIECFTFKMHIICAYDCQDHVTELDLLFYFSIGDKIEGNWFFFVITC